MLRFKMDGLLIDEVPQGWDELETTVRVDRSLVSARLVTVNTRLTWHRDGYRYLWDRFHSSDGCAQVELRIEEDPHDLGEWNLFYRGYIKLPAAAWSYQPDQVEAPVEDASFYAFLANNKSIKVPLDLQRTKNNLPMTALTDHPVELFESATGNYIQTRPMYYLDEILAYLVEYLSDGEVAFRSDVLGPGGDLQNYALQSGYRLATGDYQKGTPSFQLGEFLTQLNRNYNLGAELETAGGVPVVRVEPVDFFYQRQAQLQLDEVHPVTAEVDTSRLYAKVKVGSSVTDDAGAFPEQTRWNGFEEEEYYLLGQCNLDAELDLTRSWVVSSNVIEDIVGGSSDYDDEVVLVELLDRQASPVQALRSQFLGGTLYFYNEHLTNRAVVQRWLGGIPQSLAAELGQIPNATFYARQDLYPLAFQHRGEYYTGGAAQVATAEEPVQFDNDYTLPSYDTGASPGVYGNLTPQGSPVAAADSRFTCPATGLYSFTFRFRLYWFRKSSYVGPGFQTAARQFTMRYGFRRYNAANVLVEEDYQPWQTINMGTGTGNSGTPPPCGAYDASGWADYVWGRANWVLVTGDYVQVFLEVNTETNPGATCLLGIQDRRWVDYNVASARFYCYYSSNDFGDFTETVDANANRNVLLKFTAPVTYPELRGLLGNLSGSVEVSLQERNYRGWVESLKYDHASNLAEFTLLTSKNLLPL
jgi:hypothetical protein